MSPVIQAGGAGSGPGLGLSSGAGFNVTDITMAKCRAALAQASAKLVVHTALGDSLTSAFATAGPETPTTAWPGVLRTALTNQPDLFPDGGSIVCSADALFWPQWNPTANWTFAGGAYYQSVAAGNITYTSTDQGTATYVWYLDTAGANITYTVDGVAQAAIVRGGTNTVKAAIAVGFANATHAIVITAAAAGAIILAAGVFKASGVMFNNFAQTSSGILAGYVAIAGNLGAWTSQVPATLGYNRLGILSQLTGGSFATSQIIGICLGSNDLAIGGYSISQEIAGLALLLTQLPANAAVYLVNQFRQPSVSDAFWTNWLNALQAFAIANNLPLFDWNGRYGGYTAMLNAGLLQNDNTHPNAGGSQSIGQAIALDFAA